MKIDRKKPQRDDSQAGHGFRRERHAFFFWHYEGEKKEESPEADVVDNPRGQDFFEEASPGKKSHVLN